MGCKTKLKFKPYKGGKPKRRTKRGGASFNEPLDLSKIPESDYIPLNKGVEPNPISSRLLVGGKKRKSGRGKSKRRKTNRRKGKSKKGVFKKSKKMHGGVGGSLVGTDLLTGVNTTNSNDVFAFGTTGGSEYMSDKLTGNSVPTGAHMQSTGDMMVPLV